MQETRTTHGILASLQARLTAFHSDQGGAVALMCFAAMLVLFMVALVLWDAGEGTRNKISAQMGADTAAYSQASVRARSMNMIAFANIGKRTAVGIHNMYHLQPLMYFIWWAGQCSRCCCGFWCGCWTACRNCFGNLFKGFLPIKALIEWIKFLGQKKIKQNLQQLTKFQDDLSKYTNYWALGEAMIRGTRNGAHAIGTFPEPKNSTFGKLPVKNSNKRRGACLAPFLGDGPVTLVTLLEWYANFNNLKKRSTSKPSIAKKGPREVVNIAWSFAACLIFSPKDGSPFILTAKSKTSGQDLFHKSNFIISYHHNGGLSKKRDNYDATVGTAQTEGQGFLGNMGGFGSWSMARSEVYFPEKSAPMTIYKGRGGVDIFLYHPGWLGKLRPVTLPGEKAPSQYGNSMYSKGFKEAERLMFKKADMINMFKDMDFMAYMRDKRYGKKVFKGMDGQASGKLATDGLGK